MRDLLLVGRLERVGDWDRQFQKPRKRQPLRWDQLVQRLTLEQLHRHEPDAIGFLGRVDRDDVRMIERSDCAGFARESLEPCLVVCDLGAQKLQCDVATKPRIVSAIDLAHAARAERRLDDIVADARAGADCQDARII